MALPGNVDLITVTGQFMFIDSTYPATSSTVEFRPSGDPWLKDGGADTILLPKVVVCTVNATGQIVGPVGAQGAGSLGVKLPATNDPDLAPTGYVYDVTVKITGLQAVTYSIALPTSSPTVDLADLAPVTPVTGGGVPIVQTVNGQSPNGAGAVTITAAHVGALTQSDGDGRYLRIATYNPRKTPVALTDAATILTDATLSDHFRVTLQGNRTLANPTSPVDGQRILFEIKQDASGSRLLALDTKFRATAGVAFPLALSTGASKTDLLGVIYHSGTDTFVAWAFAKDA